MKCPSTAKVVGGLRGFPIWWVLPKMHAVPTQCNDISIGFEHQPLYHPKMLARQCSVPYQRVLLASQNASLKTPRHVLKKVGADMTTALNRKGSCIYLSSIRRPIADRHDSHSYTTIEGKVHTSSEFPISALRWIRLYSDPSQPPNGRAAGDPLVCEPGPRGLDGDDSCDGESGACGRVQVHSIGMQELTARLGPEYYPLLHRQLCRLYYSEQLSQVAAVVA